MIALAAAMGMWSAWWLTDQLSPTFGDIALLPIPLALLTKTLISFIDMPQKIAARQAIQSSVRTITPILYSGLAIVLICACMPVALQNAWLAQIGYTITLAGLGLGYFGFAGFNPQDLQATSQNPDRPLSVFVGHYSIYGLGLIGLALTSIALMTQGDDAIWVFAMSIGSVIYFYLLRWITLLWLLTRRDTSD